MEEWEVIEDSRGVKYYHNTLTSISTLDKPDVLKLPEELYRDANIRNQKVIDDFSYGDHEGLEPNLPGVGSSREEEKISESNVGFQLLKKFGWKGDGEGLGKSGQGIVAPIKAKSADTNVGLGKQDEYDKIIDETTKERKRLDIEIEQSQEVQRQRLENADREHALQTELKSINKEFYCDICDKQYKNVSEMSNHLSSYDHHHKKRFKEMKQATAPMAEDREAIRKREELQIEREIRKRQKLSGAGLNNVQNKFGGDSTETGTSLMGVDVEGAHVTPTSSELQVDDSKREKVSFSMGFKMKKK